MRNKEKKNSCRIRETSELLSKLCVSLHEFTFLRKRDVRRQSCEAESFCSLQQAAPKYPLMCVCHLEFHFFPSLQSA
jgi:hypothetical protein